MMYADQIERMREQTITPFDRMRTQLTETRKWRVIKRRRLFKRIAKVTDSVMQVTSERTRNNA